MNPFISSPLSRRTFIQWSWGIFGAVSLGGFFSTNYHRRIKATIPNLQVLQTLKNQRNSWEDPNGMDTINSVYRQKGFLLDIDYEEKIGSTIELNWDLTFSNKRVFEQWRKEVDQHGYFDTQYLDRLGVSFEISESYSDLAIFPFQA